jgi:hypothetical protein
MQNTRLYYLVDQAGVNLERWFQNPWRRTSVLLLSLFIGFFLGITIASIAGQAGRWDPILAAAVLLGVEAVSWLSYRQTSQKPRSLLLLLLNAMKIGISYSLFVEAFKLAS